MGRRSDHLSHKTTGASGQAPGPQGLPSGCPGRTCPRAGQRHPRGRQEWMGACEGRWRVSSPRGVTGGAGAGERAAGSLLRLVLEGRPARRPRGTEGGEPWQPQVSILTCPRPRPQSPSGLGWRSPRLHPTSPNVCGANTNGPRGGGGGLRFPRWGLALGPSPPDWTLDSKAPAPSPLPSPRPSLLPTPLSLHFYFKLSWLFMPIASGWVWLPLAPMPMVPPPRPGQSPALLRPGSGVRCVCAGGERAPSGEEPQECA